MLNFVYLKFISAGWYKKYKNIARYVYTGNVDKNKHVI